VNLAPADQQVLWAARGIEGAVHGQDRGGQVPQGPARVEADLSDLPGRHQRVRPRQSGDDVSVRVRKTGKSGEFHKEFIVLVRIRESSFEVLIFFHKFC
jgi:hypothetical protein